MADELDLHFRNADLEDIDTIVKWRKETSKWLASEHGSDQWSNDYPRWKLENWVNRGETWMVSKASGQEPIGTLTLSAEGSEEIWTPSELSVSALYLNKLNIVRSEAGKEIGSQLVFWCLDRAEESGVSLRIDVWTTNKKLRKYYEDLGFRYIRTVPGVVSGALYEISPETR